MSGPAAVEGNYVVSDKYKGRSYTDYVLVSGPSTSSEWFHNLMRFAPVGGGGQPSAVRTVDPRSFSKPVKLNRRDERAIREPKEGSAKKAEDVDMAEAVVSENDGKEKRDESLIAPRPGKGNESGKASGQRRGPFQKKTKQVYQTEASLAARKLAAIESHPWLLEDRLSTQRWVGRLEGGLSGHGGIQDGGTGGTSTTAGGNNALFIVGTDHSQPSMTVIPAAKTYRFVPAPLEGIVDADEAENEFARRSKGKFEDRWAVRNRRMEANPKQEENPVKFEDGLSLPTRTKQNGIKVKRENNSAERRSRAFNAVHSERASVRYANNDSGGEGSGRRGRTRNDAQDFEEFDFDAEFQDDEEGAGRYGDDVLDQEDIKELEERQKRDMQGGNHLAGDQEPTVLDADGNGLFSDEEDERQLDQEGKAAKKLFKKLQRQKRKEEGLDSASDESSEDDDRQKRNPYASDSETQTDSTSTSKRSKTKPKLPSHSSKSGSGVGTPLQRSQNPGKRTVSRGQSPSTPGTSVLVGRATSPPRRASGQGSRAASPTGSAGGRSRAGSPLAGGSTVSTSVAAGVKRKAEGTPTASNGVSEKKTRTAGPTPADLDNLITVDFLKEFFASCQDPAEATTKRFLSDVKTKLKISPRADGVMDFLKAFLQSNCSTTNGVLALKA